MKWILFLFPIASLLIFASDRVDKGLLQKLQENIEIGEFQKNIDIYKTTALDGMPCEELARIYHQIGLSYYNLNLEKDAIVHFEKSVNQWNNCKTPNREEIANSLFNIGVSYQYTNEIYSGKLYIDSSLAIIESLPKLPFQKLVNKYEGAGSYYVDIKDYTRAENLYKNAEALLRKNKSPNLMINLMHQFSMFLDFKKYDKARNLLHVMNNMNPNINEVLTNDDLAIVNLNAASLYHKLQNLDSSYYFAKKSLALINPDEINLRSNAHEILGLYYLKKGKINLATAEFEKTLKLRESQGGDIIQSHIALSYSLENIAEAQLANNDLDKAQQSINVAIGLLVNDRAIDKNHNPIINSEYIENVSDIIRQLLLKDRILYAGARSEQRLMACVVMHHKIDSLFQKSMQQVTLHESRLELISIMDTHTENAIDRLMDLYQLTKDTNYIDQAFYFSSKAKSSGLLYGINERSYIEQYGDINTKNKALALNSHLQEVDGLLLENGNNIDSLMEIKHKILIDIEKINKSFTKDIAIDFNKLNNNATVKTAKQIGDLLTKDQVVLDFYYGVRNLYCFIVKKSKLAVVIVPHEKIDGSLDAHMASLSSPSSDKYMQSGKDLYNAFLSEIVSNYKFAKGQNLIILPHGKLHFIPFESLVNNDNQFLIKDYVFTYSYSSSLLFYSTKNLSYEYPFIAYGTDYSDDFNTKLQNNGYLTKTESLSRLESYADELNACKSVYQNKYYTGNQASINNFIDFAKKSKIVYISLHGVIDKLENKKTALLFNDREKNFIFNSFDLYKQNIPSDLVIMSACNTAAGRMIQGDGLNGMTSAFLNTGVQNIVSSLWEASEGSTKKILPEFLRLQKDNNHSYAESLQQAKLNYLDQATPSMQHPYYWANFVLIGKVDEADIIDNKSNYYYLFFCVILVLSFFIFWFVKKNRKPQSL